MSGEVIVFPDVEDLLCRYIQGELEERGYPGIAVGTRVPNPRPDTFVRIMAIGGSRRNLAIDAPSVVVEGWSLYESDAVQLMQLCRGLVHAIDIFDGHQFYQVSEAGSPINLPDPVSSHIRYTSTFQVPVRGYAV